MCLAIPGKVASISGEDPLMRAGKVDFGGILKEVSLAYVPEVKVGDYVIVHVGFALSRVDEEEAKQVFEYLRQMEELSELDEGRAGDSPAAPAVSPAAAGPPGQ
jgi:hydrogenase expression/formation protein HypC